MAFVLDFPGRVRAHIHAADGIRERFAAFRVPVGGVVAGSMMSMVVTPIVEAG
jgi:hypothetical protein